MNNSNRQEHYKNLAVTLQDKLNYCTKLIVSGLSLIDNEDVAKTLANLYDTAIKAASAIGQCHMAITIDTYEPGTLDRVNMKLADSKTDISTDNTSTVSEDNNETDLQHKITLN